MPWVRIDDQFPDHPKIDQAGPLAGWLYVCGLAYCNRQLTDGFIPRATMARLSTVPNPVKVAAALVAAGLWDAVEGGWQVHDYLTYQPSRAKILHERELAAKRQASRRDRGRDSRRESAGSSAAPPQAHPHLLTSDSSLSSSTGSERDTAGDNPVEYIRSQKRGSADAAKRARAQIAPVPDLNDNDADRTVTL